MRQKNYEQALRLGQTPGQLSVTHSFRDMLKNRLLKRAFCILSENAEARKRRIRLDTTLSDETFVAKIQKA